MKVEMGVPDFLAGMMGQSAAVESVDELVFRDLLANEIRVKQPVHDEIEDNQPSVEADQDMSLSYANSLVVMGMDMPVAVPEALPQLAPDHMPVIQSEAKDLLQSPEILRSALNDMNIVQRDATDLPQFTPRPMPVIQSEAKDPLQSPESLSSVLNDMNVVQRDATDLPQFTPRPMPVIQSEAKDLLQPPESLRSALNDMNIVQRDAKDLPQLAPQLMSVIQSEAKDLLQPPEILRSALNDMNIVQRDATDLPQVTPRPMNVIQSAAKDLPQLAPAHNQEILRFALNDMNVVQRDAKELPQLAPQLMSVIQSEAKDPLQPAERLHSALNDVNIVQSEARDLPGFDTMVNNMADFFNKKLATADSVSTKIPGYANSDLRNILDNPSPVQSIKYNVGSLTNALTVDGYTAKLKVYPADLGQITADIQVNKGMTDIRLSTENTLVKQFIEAHLQPLRDSFQGMNIQLGDVQVQEQYNQERQAFQQKQEQGNKQPDWRQELPAQQAAQTAQRPSNSLVDTYA